MTKVRQRRKAQAARKALVDNIAKVVVVAISIPSALAVFAAIGMVLSVN